jgi:hypothetical protein
MTTASAAATSPSLIELAIQYWWLVWLALIVGGSMLEGVRDFFVSTYLQIIRARHKHRMAEIKAQRKAAGQQALADSALTPGPCQHIHTTRVVDDNDKLVAWLCLNEDCSEQLPANWAVRKKDLM